MAILPHWPSPSAAADRQLRLAVISERRDAWKALRDEFNLVVVPFPAIDAEFVTLQTDVVLVDAIDTYRFAEVSRIALAGTRDVLVIGSLRDGADAMRYLDLGASDYVSANVSTAELGARLKAIARRSSLLLADDTIVCGPITISVARRQVRRGGELIRLTPTEFGILEVLARNAGKFVSHRQLLSAVWGPEHSEARHYLRIYIRQLREKLEPDPAVPAVIETERGIGYRLGVDDAGKRSATA